MSPRFLLAVLALLPAAVRAAEPLPFTFAAFGCVPYARHPGSEDAFRRLLAEVDRHQPAFAVHLGDTLGGDERATDAFYLRRRADFNRLATALVYTPGDNEWTDTHRPGAGGFDPLERLARLREVYFAEERSLGGRPLPLVTQRRDPAHARFVEHARWTLGGVVFATLHVVGSHNNHQPTVPGALAEWRERDAAVVAWIRATFAAATETAAPGVVLFFQADPFGSDRNRPGYDPGFENFLRALEAAARAFGRPVLLVHADEHRYRLDEGLRFTAEGERVPNVTRLETFGAENIHGVLVTVDPASRAVFAAGPLIVPGNPLPRLPRAKAGR
jgi:hypothetical protein